jgi:hypothetical protein
VCIPLHGFITTVHLLHEFSECGVRLRGDRARKFAHVGSLGVVLTFDQVGVVVGEAENPRTNVPKGLYSVIFPCVPTNPGPQPYEEVC